MIVQHPLLWCAVLLMAGMAIGFHFPFPCYLPLLAVAVVASTQTLRTKHLHDVMTLIVWLLLGCSRAVVTDADCQEPAWISMTKAKAKTVQTSLVARIESSGVAPRTLAVCSALAVGKKDGLKRDIRQAYARVGASHLLALSGMHLGIIYGFLYFFLIHHVRHGHWRWFSLPVVLLCLWGYALVAGMPVSLVRAALMLSLLSVLLLMQFDTDPLHPLALSAIVILMVEPASLLSVSFQLSFAAVFFLLSLWSPLSNRFPELNWAVKLVAVSCVAQLGTMPLTLYYFHQLPLLAPLLSLVLIPMTTLIIYLTLACIVLPIAPLAWTLNLVEDCQQRLIDVAGSILCGTLTDIYPSAILVALIYAAMIVAVVRLRTRISGR